MCPHSFTTGASAIMEHSWQWNGQLSWALGLALFGDFDYVKSL